MLLNMNEILSTLVGLFLIIGLGYLAVKRNILNKNATPFLSTLLMKIALPCTVFISMQRSFDPNFLKDGMIILVLGFAISLSFSAIAMLMSKLLKVKQGNRGAWMLSCAYCNGGFMGFPIALAFFGEEGLSLAAILNIPFVVLIYTVGIKLVCTDSASEDKAKTSLIKIIFSVVNIATMLGLLFYIAQISVPSVLLTPIEHLSNITTPLSMLIVGMTLAASNATSLFSNFEVLTSSAMRLIILPALVFALMLVLPIENPVIPSLLVTIYALPTAAIAPAMSAEYGGNQDLAAKITFLTSLLSVLTIPLWSIIL